MEHYINNLLFTYFPHISMAVFWFGLITRFVKTSRTIQAQSNQFLAEDGLRWGSNFFHYGIILVFFGHFSGLLTPEKWYHLVMTTEVKRILAVSLGSVFGGMTLIGIIILIVRRFRNERIRINSSPQDYFIIFLLLFEVVLGMRSISRTIVSPVENYAALGEWAQMVVTFQPNAGAVLADLSIVYKLHIFVGMLIFIIFPYTKLMHILVVPLQYFIRTGYQLVRKSQ